MSRIHAKAGAVDPGRVTKEYAVLLKELIEAGRNRVVIDRTCGLEDVVDAHRYVDTGQKVGNVILTVAGVRP